MHQFHNVHPPLEHRNMHDMQRWGLGPIGIGLLGFGAGFLGGELAAHGPWGYPGYGYGGYPGYGYGGYPGYGPRPYGYGGFY